VWVTVACLVTIMFHFCVQTFHVSTAGYKCWGEKVCIQRPLRMVSVMVAIQSTSDVSRFMDEFNYNLGIL